jgi:hypothetical protein
VTRPLFLVSSKAEDIGDKQSTIIVDVINLFVVMNDRLTGIAIDQVD